MSRAASRTSLDAEVPADRWDALRRWGDFTLAYSIAHQPGLRHFGDDAGYLAYVTRWGYAFVLGDPLASPAQSATLLRDFVRRRPRAVFVQCSARTAQVLAEEGLFVNRLGVDTSLELADYDFRGREREWLRYAANWVTRRGMQVLELPLAGGAAEAAREISTAWQATRVFAKREVAFLNRPLSNVDEPDVRKFFLADEQGRLVALVLFDPLYRDGQVIGYCTCIKRRRPDAPTYAEAAIMKQAIDVFRAEGRTVLTLGLSPLANIEEEPFRHNPLLRFSFRSGFRAGWVNRWFYALQGHAQYKRRFRGREELVFFASNAWFNDLRIVALLKACGIF
jgi:phosphatidylglycerol lysyltransferase